MAASAYHWPGNIRELANVIERALILSPGATLSVDETLGASAPLAPDFPSAQHLEEIERAHILAVLRRANGASKGRGRLRSV